MALEGEVGGQHPVRWGRVHLQKHHPQFDRHGPLGTDLLRHSVRLEGSGLVWLVKDDQQHEEVGVGEERAAKESDVLVLDGFELSGGGRLNVVSQFEEEKVEKRPEKQGKAELAEVGVEVGEEVGLQLREPGDFVGVCVGEGEEVRLTAELFLLRPRTPAFRAVLRRALRRGRWRGGRPGSTSC